MHGPGWPPHRRDVVKRMLDVGVAAGALTIGAPVWLLIAVAIKLDSRGPVIYRSSRVGRDGGLFAIYKFRTMIDNALRGPRITASNDLRITRVGRLLRSTKLDEIPQVFNVLRGEMSLVGPRPEDPVYVTGYSPEQREILRYRPGITSPASVAFRHEEAWLASCRDEAELNGRYKVVLDRKIRLDLNYFRQASIRGDIGVMRSTAIAILRQRKTDPTTYPKLSES